ncbi:MAG TPA: DUF4400 domain-containing protein [Terriglobales bacterium]|jgi:hypothetical protein|nr:DUF4400 domain-containing protein [Terriglobales bacterium]
MRLLWIGILILLFVSLASLISDGRSANLIQRSWVAASSVIPETILTDFQHASARYTARLFASLPEPFREKMSQKMWSAVELVTFRSLVLLHLVPALLLPLLIGFLEGWWTRASQRSLIKIHSPMRFSLALTGLELIPIMALLWVTAPIAIPAMMLVLLIAVFAMFNTRNLILHAPTQF